MFKKSDYEKEGAFTVASFAEVLNTDNSCSRLNSLWQLKAQPRVLVFGWLALQGCILTIDNLHMWNMMIINACSMYLAAEESVGAAHLEFNSQWFWLQLGLTPRHWRLVQGLEFSGWFPKRQNHVVLVVYGYYLGNMKKKKGIDVAQMESALLLLKLSTKRNSLLLHEFPFYRLSKGSQWTLLC